MPHTPIDLAGVLVAVTGSARGIGLATAKAFYAAGAHVAIGDLDAGLAAEAAAELGERASGHALDVTDRASFSAYLEAAQAAHGGPLEVLVNNAGIMPTAAFLEQREEIDRMTMEINYFGMATGLRLALPGMIERGRGHIINVCSMVSVYPLQGLAGYNASKFAARGLTQSVRLETAGTGVNVSAVLPSAVKTELASGIDFGLMPQVEPEDIAAGVLRAVRTGSPEISVPRYLGAAAKAGTLFPELVMRPMRRLLRDDAPLTHVDAAGRAAYHKRIVGNGE
ncbi:SDR family oxidoreductase [Nocardia sp. GTS18]|uniref:SDR family oxidoreductase n=1 Tax=Nocardia sp. GTS18 TaxID=1778064 RepID=UPI0015EFB833|nr:SDR family oxidoreductase [Nocardia sp. GTS18]